MRAAALLMALALTGCAGGGDAPAPQPAPEAAAQPARGVYARGIERRRAEIAALAATAGHDPAAAARIRRLNREIAQLQEDAVAGPSDRATPQVMLRF